MKLRDLVYLLGFRPPPRVYPSEVRTFDLPGDGRVEYARWLHPGETEKVIRQEVLDEIRTVITPGDVVLDIGAHTGDTAVPLALAAGPSGMVFALEPNPYVFPVLEQNAALNAGKAAPIVPLNFAATRERGEVEFEYSDAGFCNGGRHEGISRWRHGHAFRLKVRGENLVAYLQRYHPDALARTRYVKIDAEGYDLQVLRSLEPLIDSVRPSIRVEVFKLLPPGPRGELFSFLASRGYRIFRVADDTRLRGRELTSADVPDGHFDLFAEAR